MPLNSFKRNIKVRFDLQAEDAVFGDDEISIACPFEGWSDKEDGSVLFQNGASFLNLLDCSGTKQWYAHWGEAAYTVQKMPNRMGYQFAGWSTDPNAVQGQSAFSFSEDTTLYAIWKADVVEYHVEYYKAFLKKQLRMLFMVIPVKRFLLRMWSNYIPDTILMRHRRHYPDVLKETEVLCCPYIIVVIPIHCSSIWKVEACRQNTGN